MRMKLGIAAAILASVIGIGSALAQAKQVVRVVHPPGADLWPYFIAKKEGFFEKRGLDVQPTMMALSSNIPAALASGSAEIGVLTVATLLPAIENGLDLVTVAGGTIASPDFPSSLLTKPDSPIKEPKDIEGRKVGIPGIGAFLQIMFNEWLATKGVDPKKVIYVEVPFTQMQDVLQAGTVDAVIPIEPFITRIIGTKVGEIKFSYIKELTATKSYRILVSSMTRDYASKNAATIKSVREALEEAVAFHAKNPAKSKEDVGEFVKMPPQALAAVKLSPSPAMVSDAEIADWSTILVKQKIMSKPVDPAKFNIK